MDFFWYKEDSSSSLECDYSLKPSHLLGEPEHENERPAKPPHMFYQQLGRRKNNVTTIPSSFNSNAPLDELTREIYMDSPHGFPTEGGKVCRLKKALNELK